MAGRDVQFGIRIRADKSGFVNETRDAARGVKEFGDAAKKSAQESESAYARLNSSITTRLQSMQLEQQAGRKLYEGERLHLQLVNDVAAGRLKLTDVQAGELRGKLEAIKSIEAESRALKESAAARERTTATISKYAAVAATAVAAAAVGAVAALRSEISALDDLEETARSLNTTAVELADTRLRAQEFGVSAEQLDRALAKLNQRLADARRGGTESSLIFEALGFDMERVRDGSITAIDALKLISEQFRTYKDGVGEINLASELFGSAGGRKLVDLLNQGSDALQRNSGLTAETVSEAARLQSEIDLLTASWMQLKNELVGGVVPGLNRALQLFRDFDSKQFRSDLTDYPLSPALAAGRAIGRVRDAQRQREEAERAGALTRIENDFRSSQGQVDAPNIGALERARKQREKDEEEARKAAERASKDAIKRAEEQARELERLSAQSTAATLKSVSALASEAEALERVNRQLAEHNEEIGLSRFEVDELQASRIEDAVATREQALAMARLSEASEGELALMKRQIEALREQARLRRAGNTAAQSEEARRKKQDEADAELKRREDEQKRNRERTADDAKSILGSALYDSFEDSRSAWRQLIGDSADYLKRRFTQSLADAAVEGFVRPLTDALADFLFQLSNSAGRSSAGGGGGDLGDLFISLFGLHSGGIVGSEATFSRAVPARALRGAPKYHRGGIAGDERVAILRSGEGVFTPEQMARLAPAGGGITVNIQNNADAQVTARQSDDGMSIEVLIERIDESLAANLSSGRGALGNAVQNRFGLRAQAR